MSQGSSPSKKQLAKQFRAAFKSGCKDGSIDSVKALSMLLPVAHEAKLPRIIAKKEQRPSSQRKEPLEGEEITSALLDQFNDSRKDVDNASEEEMSDPDVQKAVKLKKEADALLKKAKADAKIRAEAKAVAKAKAAGKAQIKEQTGTPSKAPKSHPLSISDRIQRTSGQINLK